MLFAAIKAQWQLVQDSSALPVHAALWRTHFLQKARGCAPLTQIWAARKKGIEDVFFYSYGIRHGA